jgi:hypothetical protein
MSDFSAGLAIRVSKTAWAAWATCLRSQSHGFGLPLTGLKNSMVDIVETAEKRFINDRSFFGGV